MGQEYWVFHMTGGHTRHIKVFSFVCGIFSSCIVPGTKLLLQLYRQAWHEVSDALHGGVDETWGHSRASWEVATPSDQSTSPGALPYQSPSQKQFFWGLWRTMMKFIFYKFCIIPSFWTFQRPNTFFLWTFCGKIELNPGINEMKSASEDIFINVYKNWPTSETMWFDRAPLVLSGYVEERWSIRGCQ